MIIGWLAQRLLPRHWRARPVSRTVESKVSWIEAGELSARLAVAHALVVVDVREPDEFNGELGHIAGARNISVQELPQRMRDLDRFKKDAVVLVCRTQMRSAKAAAMLTEAGFRDVRVLRGGMVEWVRQRHPIEGHR